MYLMVGKRRFRVRLGDRGRVQCEPGWHLGRGWASFLSDYDLWFVRQGRGRMRSDEGEFELRPGSVFWMRPGRHYEACHDAAAPLGVTYIHFRLEPDGSSPPEGWKPPFEALQVVRWDVFDAALGRVLERGREPEALALAETWMATILADLIHEHRSAANSLPSPGVDRHNREKIERIAERIRESPGATPPVAGMARTAGFSVDHFSRVFFRVLGERPQAYVIRCKLERACVLLAESDLPVGLVAEALGFSDIFYFSRQFREKLGVTPSAYRSRLAKERSSQRRLPSGPGAGRFSASSRGRSRRSSV